MRTVQRPHLTRELGQSELFAHPAEASTLATVAQYDLDQLDRTIAQMEGNLARVDVVDPGPDPSAVAIGTEIVVRDAGGTEETLLLVGPFEADPASGRIGSDSPAGTALLGKRAGATVKIGSGPSALDLTVKSIKRARDRLSDQPSETDSDLMAEQPEV